MGETSGQIETHIRNTREDLSANLSELEQKVKSVTDWRQQFQKSPGTFLAVAAGAGLLVALLTKGSKSAAAASGPYAAAPPRAKAPGPFDESINEIKSALIGVAASQAKNVLAKFVPGFEEQLGGSSARKTYSSGQGRETDPPLAH